MPNPQQSQSLFPNSQLKINNWLEDGDENISETKVENEDVSEEDEKDWFLEAFLVGYRTEKDRRKRVGAEKEERKKRAIAREKIEKERRREERENFENRLVMELKDMRNTLETVKEEKRKLRQEVEELRKSVREEKIVRVVVEIINGAKEDDISQVVSKVIPTQVSVPSPKYQGPSPKLHNPPFRRLPLLMCNPRSCSNPPFCLLLHTPFHLHS